MKHVLIGLLVFMLTACSSKTDFFLLNDTASPVTITIAVNDKASAGMYKSNDRFYKYEDDFFSPVEKSGLTSGNDTVSFRLLPGEAFLLNTAFNENPSDPDVMLKMTESIRTIILYHPNHTTSVFGTHLATRFKKSRSGNYIATTSEK